MSRSVPGPSPEGHPGAAPRPASGGGGAAPAENGVGRDTLDRSESGAPASGHAVRDLFSTDEIFQRLIATADEEFVRPGRLLFWSGIAAGLSIAISFVARSAMTAELGEGGAVLGTLLYPIGFVLIVLGRYQLFTENTLTPVVLVLSRIASVPMLLRLWGIVLAANLIGASAMALVLARTGVLDADSALVAKEIATHALSNPPGALFWKGVFAGWLVASMVWLNHAARDTITRFFLVFAIMSLVPLADLYHCIIGACEAMYLVFLGEATLAHAFLGFFLPVVLGNTVGGVLLVAIVNYAQTRSGHFKDRKIGSRALTWRQWFFGMGAGGPDQADNAPLTGTSETVDPEQTGSLLDREVPEDTKNRRDH